MATHAAIIMMRSDDTCAGIYVHWDGHPETTGRILLDHYSTHEKVDALIQLGDLRALEDTLEKTAALSYHRRGERLNITIGKSIESLICACDVSNVYVWHGEDDPRWEYRGLDLLGFNYQTLREAVEQAEHKGAEA